MYNSNNNRTGKLSIYIYVHHCSVPFRSVPFLLHANRKFCNHGLLTLNKRISLILIVQLTIKKHKNHNFNDNLQDSINTL